MSLIRFLASSLALSIPVTLRMLPIFLVAAALGSVVAYGLRGHPYYLAFVAVVAWFPLMAFMTLCAIRAGLVQMRQSHGPELNKLVRKSLIFGLIFAGLGLFYLILQAGVVVATLNLRGWGEWTEFLVRYQALNLEPQPMLLSLFHYNAALGLGMGAALAVYMLINAAFAVPVAAHGAMIGVGGPHHEFLYGIGRMMVPMLIVTALSGLLAWYVPPLLNTLFLHDTLVDATTFAQPALDILKGPVARWFALLALFWLWLFCWYAAAAAVAYVGIRDKIEDEFQETLGAIRASAVPTTDLSALMRERTERLRSVNFQPGTPGLLDDSDETQPADTELFDDLPPPSPAPAEEPAKAIETDDVEERFQQRFGDSANGLRGDISSALREAAELTNTPEAPEPPGQIDAGQVEAGRLDAPLEPEKLPPVEPDQHHAVPEGDDHPDWLGKYMGSEADKTIFGKKNK